MRRFLVSYGSINEPDEEILEFPNEAAAVNYAYEAACDDYDSYAGLHGLRDIDEIMEDEGVDEDTAYEIFTDERESWLSYDAKEVT